MSAIYYFVQFDFTWLYDENLAGCVTFFEYALTLEKKKKKKLWKTYEKKDGRRRYFYVLSFLGEIYAEFTEIRYF